MARKKLPPNSNVIASCPVVFSGIDGLIIILEEMKLNELVVNQVFFCAIWIRANLRPPSPSSTNYYKYISPAALSFYWKPHTNSHSAATYICIILDKRFVYLTENM